MHTCPHLFMKFRKTFAVQNPWGGWMVFLGQSPKKSFFGSLPSSKNLIHCRKMKTCLKMLFATVLLITRPEAIWTAACYCSSAATNLPPPGSLGSGWSHPQNPNTHHALWHCALNMEQWTLRI